MGRVPRVLFVLAGLCPLWAADPLNLYFIDTEGGHATLVVAPSGASLLIDTGHEGYGGRDATRIRTAARDAGVKKIDYLLVTRFESDHIGGLKNLLEVLPVGVFLDDGAGTGGYPEAYQAEFAKGKHQVMGPGFQIPIKGLNVTMICGAVLIEFSKFRFASTPWRFSSSGQGLCPQTVLGKIDVFLTSLRGPEPQQARVVIVNNGPRKGGDAGGWKDVMASPGIEDLWQLHFAMANGSEANAPDALIANLQEAGDGSHLKVSVATDGSFTILNTRNKYSRKYGPAAR